MILNDNDNLVSVIMPAYNAEKYIKASVQSVLEQSYDRFEFIIVNDFSTDNTASIVGLCDDKRIRLYHHDQNRGPGAARNTAIENSRGKWIALIDADDLWHKDRLKILVETAKDLGQGYFVSDLRVLCFETPKGLLPWHSRNNTDYGKLIMAGKKSNLSIDEYIASGCPPINPMVPIEVISKLNLKYNETSRIGEDTEFYFHLFKSGLLLNIISEEMYYYRITKGSLTKRPEIAKDYLDTFNRLLVTEGFSQLAYNYFLKRIDYITKDIAVTEIVQYLKARQYRKAGSKVYKNPILAYEFVKRVPVWGKKYLKALQAKVNLR